MEAPGYSSGAPSKRVIIVGAGIVGAVAAHSLARAGHEVVVLDGGLAASGATGSSFAWVGTAKSSAAAQSAPLRSRAGAEFDRLLEELPEPIGYRPFGALSWEESDALTREFVAEHQELGSPISLITGSRAMTLEPRLKAAPGAVAHSPGDAGVDPAALTRALLSSARRNGAKVLFDTAVTRLLADGGRVRGVATETEELTGASVVIAAGTGSVALAGTAGVTVDLEPAPCCLLRFSTPHPIVRGIVSTPELEIRQFDDTTLLAAEDVPDGFSDDPARLAAPALEAIRSRFRGTDELRLQHAVIADRPMPRSGEPLLGPAEDVPGLYLAIAHPAVILSGAIGRRITDDHAALVGLPA